jgi:hypothetical protein
MKSMSVDSSSYVISGEYWAGLNIPTTYTVPPLPSGVHIRGVSITPNSYIEIASGTNRPGFGLFHDVRFTQIGRYVMSVGYGMPDGSDYVIQKEIEVEIPLTSYQPTLVYTSPMIVGLTYRFTLSNIPTNSRYAYEWDINGQISTTSTPYIDVLMPSNSVSIRGRAYSGQQGWQYSQWSYTHNIRPGI